MKLSRHTVLPVLLALVGAVALVGCGGDPAAPLATPTQAQAVAEPTSASESEPEVTATTAQATGGWVTYTPDDATFKIEFPGEPTEQSMPANTALGEITLHSVGYAGSGPEYNLTYNDLPSEMAGMDAVTAAATLEGSLKGASQGNEILSQEVVQVGGHPGIKGEVDMAENHAWYMSVITPRHQYQLVVVTSDQGKETYTPDAERFLNSFAVTGD